MLWGDYVFRRGTATNELWESLFAKRDVRLLYIAGGGFDVRAQRVMHECLGSLKQSGARVQDSRLLLVEFSNYQLSDELQELTRQNAEALSNAFSAVGGVDRIEFGADPDKELSASVALRNGTEQVLQRLGSHTDIILDASSLPRVIYLALMTNLLGHLIPDKQADNPLAAGGVNFQVLVAEDPVLDGLISAEDPSSEIVMVPGFHGAMQAESTQERPYVWFPILGENRSSQLQVIMRDAQMKDVEVCPVLPHPSRNPRRADKLLLEYREALFRSGEANVDNVMFVHESHPFEAYRQLLSAMSRYRESLSIVGGCKLVVTPLGSKLITLGAGLACFEMRPTEATANYGVAIPHAEPKRYVVSSQAIKEANPVICSLLLTGEAYA